MMMIGLLKDEKRDEWIYHQNENATCMAEAIVRFSEEGRRVVAFARFRRIRNDV
jgi:hypothetical protein